MFNFILFSLSQAGIIGLTQGRTGWAWVLPSGAASETRGRGGSHEDRRRRPPTRRPTHKDGDATHRGLEEIHRQWDDDDQLPEDGVTHLRTDRQRGIRWTCIPLLHTPDHSTYSKTIYTRSYNLTDYSTFLIFNIYSPYIPRPKPPRPKPPMAETTRIPRKRRDLQWLSGETFLSKLANSRQ